MSAAQHAELDRGRTWSDDTTHDIHESQTLHIERIHEAPAHETAWVVAAYETPVSDRMWHLTATGAAPAPVLQELLDHLADGDRWDTAVGGDLDEKSVTAATRPLVEAGWKHRIDGRWMRWTNLSEDAGVQFDAFAAQKPSSPLATWTIWAGPSVDQPTWALHASPHAPASMIASLATELAHGTGTRCPLPPGARRQPPQRTTTLPAAAPTGPRLPAGRLR
ncbi:DUF317 domain-containing protein [Streptomyces sp. NPDC048637]|uniref:DUF317 domain-containing protein n=1 Tax=Streptomyces TaxID=1883 RepID=UPI003422945F